ncbi:DUF4270 domain-containing protein [Winogradskyella sp. A3E31]|uniref:DUF4270 domain-containing protein n=1 Tax=Winogradskyella sp. A3E31 TaxID=3349637 RepID=UPI00398AB5BB
MNTYKIALRYLFLTTLILTGFISCDKDFAGIESDIINEGNATNFDTNSETYDVISYTDVLGPVQTNSLPYNFLGYYDDPYYGTTTASIVTQVSSALLDPTFGENAVLDSVVLTIPYFSSNVGVTDDNEIEYRLDSIFPRNDSDDYNPIKLSIYENNYFLRDFDPNEDFDTPQAYFSNRTLSSSEMISDADLESTLIHADTLEISDDQINLDDENGEVSQIQAPAIRLLLDPVYWKDKILDQEGTSFLRNSNNFNNYFRGLYFKAEAINDNGSLIGLNLAATNANITLYYTADSTNDASVRNQSSYVLTFGGNRVNFFENNFNAPIPQGDSENGDSQLFLKGGQGAVAGIKLFDGLNEENEPVFEAFKNNFANYDEDGEFESSKRLINEANLVFFVDQAEMQAAMVNGQEPNRLYLYDMDNNTPLIDYFFDISSSSFPSLSRPNHLGVLQRVDDEPDGLGIKYKMKITEHIKNLVQNDSTNVTLGLAISGNVNLEESFPQRIEQTTDNSEKLLPVSSIISPRGIVLHGNNSEIEAKKLYLEIFYTCLYNDCEENN